MSPSCSGNVYLDGRLLLIPVDVGVPSTVNVFDIFLFPPPDARTAEPVIAEPGDDDLNKMRKYGFVCNHMYKQGNLLVAMKSKKCQNSNQLL